MNRNAVKSLIVLLLFAVSVSGCSSKKISSKDSKDGVLHIVIVCHAESDPWDCGYRGLLKGTPQMMAVFQKVGEMAGIKIPTTFCVNPPTAKPEFFGSLYKQLLEDGHEIGLHTQGGAFSPGKQHKTLGPEDNEKRIPGDVKELVALGFPQPRTYTPGNFSYIPTTTRVLEDAGIEVSCSVLPGEAGADGYDYTSVKSYKPYNPSYENNGLPGNSKLVEIPVSAWFTNLGTNRGEIISHLQTRLVEAKESGEVDIFQIIWHPWEVIESKDYAKNVIEFLLLISNFKGMRFSTASEAAKAWRDAQNSS
ncbi:hypothetical protein ACFL96_02220 [Thermoproteota archaeon]